MTDLPCELTKSNGNHICDIRTPGMDIFGVEIIMHILLFTQASWAMVEAARPSIITLSTVQVSASRELISRYLPKIKL